MALRITDDEIRSDVTQAYAVQIHPGHWTVFGHMDLTGTADLDRNAAITAMTLAEVYAENPPADSPIWLHVKAWREELGITDD